MGWLAWAVPTVISLIGSLYGQNKARQNAKDLQNQQQPLIDAQLKNMQFLQPFAQQLLGSGQGNMGQVQNLLQQQIGNRGSAMQANAPLINQMTEAQQGATAAQRSLYPRGGQTASQASQLPYQLQGNISNLLFGARQNAIGQLGQLGANQASLGLGASGQGAGLTNSMLGYGLNAQGQMFGQGAQIGQGISSMIGPFMQYMMMNQRRTDTSGQNSPWTYPGQNPSGTSFSLLGGGGQGGSGGTNMGAGSTPNYTPYNTPGKWGG